MGDWEKVSAENLVRHKSGGYYLRAKISGKIIRRSLQTTSLKIAKLKRDALIIELRTAAGLVKGGEDLALVGAVALTRAYYAALPSYETKPASMAYREQLLSLLERTLPNRVVASWTAEEIRTWWSSPVIRAYSAQRRNNTLGTLRKLFEMAIACGSRVNDPSVGLTKVKVRRVSKTLPVKEDFAAILVTIRSQNKRYSLEAANFVEFMALSGARHHEAKMVSWADVSADWIVIHGGELGTKNLIERRVPIIPPMRVLLDKMRYDGATGPLFDMGSPRYALKNACVRLGLEHMKLHELRHLFATACVESGVDYRTLADWLGHKDGGTLAATTYSHLRSDHASKMAAKVTF